MPRYVITHTINDDGIVTTTTATSALYAVVGFWKAIHPGGCDLQGRIEDE